MKWVPTKQICPSLRRVRGKKIDAFVTVWVTYVKDGKRDCGEADWVWDYITGQCYWKAMFDFDEIIAWLYAKPYEDD